MSRIDPLDSTLAKAAGVLLAQAGSSETIDAIVVESAAKRGDAILTSDPDEVGALAYYRSVSVRRVS